MVSEKSVISPKKACSDVSRFILSRIFTSDPNPTALSDVYRLFTTICVSCHSSSIYDWTFVLITHCKVDAK